MSHVKISHPGPMGGGTQIEVDGHPIKDVARIQLDFPVDDVAQCHVGIAVTQPFEIEMGMDVHLHLHVPKDHQLIDVTTQEMAGKRFMVVKTGEERG